MSFAPPIVPAHFHAIAAPLDSFGVVGWHELAPLAAVPSTPRDDAKTAERVISASVLAWRQNYYAFRAARSRVLTGNIPAAREVLAGPQGAYVRNRFAKLAANDARFNLTTGPLTTPPPPANRCARETRSARPDRRMPRRAPVPVPALTSSPIVAPPVIVSPISTDVIVNRESLRKALRAVILATPEPKSKRQRRKGDPEFKRVRILTSGDAVRVISADHPDVRGIDVSEVQHFKPIDSGAVNAAILLKIFSLSVDDHTLSLEQVGNVLHIRGDDAHYQLLTWSV